MKSNIALICMLPNYASEVGELLSEKLEMFFVNIDDMVKFEVGDVERINSNIDAAGAAEFIQKCEDKVVKNVASFENTIICLSPQIMFNNQNFEILSNTCYVAYLQISPKFFEKRAKFSADVLDKDFVGTNFTDCDKLYVDKSDMLLNCSTYRENKAVKKLGKIVKKFFKKRRKAEKKAELRAK